MEYGLKAFIPLRCKKVALGPGVGLAPQRHYFASGIPTCWYLKILKFAFPLTQNIKFAFPLTQKRKFAFPPMQNPNASQWNIGCVGFQTQKFCVGHVRFIFFVLISFALGSRRKHSFQWNMGFSLYSTESWRWLRPPMLQFSVGDTNMLVSKNAKICVTPNANFKICLTPNVKPQSKSVEYRLRWAKRKLLALGMYISYFLG